tara:strand:+ start:127 stop:489 length:363 start_codon:yes stop_codon:yes gene_type:complete
MEDKEVLQKAIEIAIRNGMTLRNPTSKSMSGDTIQESSSFTEKFEVPISLSTIFSHDFAKAFWGCGSFMTSEIRNIYKGRSIIVGIKEMPKWRFHLQEMVLEENPIDYLRKFIDNTENRK